MEEVINGILIREVETKNIMQLFWVMKMMK